MEVVSFVGGRPVQHLAYGLDAYIAPLHLPYLIGLSSTAPIGRMIEASEGKMSTTLARRFPSLFNCSNVFVECSLVLR